MKKLLFLGFVLLSTLISAQTDNNHFIIDYEDEKGVIVQSSLSKDNFQYPDIENCRNIDTLFISLNIPDVDIFVIESFYIYAYEDFTWISDTLAYIILNSDHAFNVAAKSYDGYSNSLVCEENYTMNGTDTLEFNFNDAIHEIEFQPLNNDGVPFSQLGGISKNHTSVLIPMHLGYFGVLFERSLSAKIYCSELSSNCLIQCSSLHYDENPHDAYFIEYPTLVGINQNHLMTNQAEDYVSAYVQMHVTNQQVSETKFAFMRGCMWPNKWGHFACGIHGSTLTIDPIEFWNGEIFLIKQDNNRCKAAHRILVYTYKEPDILNSLSESPLLEVINDSISGFYTMDAPFDAYKAGYTDTLFWGESPITFGKYPGWNNMWFNNNPDNMIMALTGCFGMSREATQPRGEYTFYNIKDAQGNVLVHGEGAEYVHLENVDPGKYYVELVKLPAPTSGGFGRSTLNASFNFGATDASPPFISPVQFRDSQNKLNYQIGSGEQLSLLFSAVDLNDMYDSIYGDWTGTVYQPVIHDSTKVFIREYNSTVWQEIDIEKYHEDSVYGYYYKADLTPYTNLDSSALNLKISIQDYSGNTAEYVISPAILIGGFQISTGIETEADKKIDFELSIFPNPASTQVNFQISSLSEAILKLSIYDLNGSLVYADPSIKTDIGINDYSWNLRDQSGTTIKPGVYFCVVENGNQRITKKLVVN